ncbi:MAG: sulfatase [Planctomycetota bacterium]
MTAQSVPSLVASMCLAWSKHHLIIPLMSGGVLAMTMVGTAADDQTSKQDARPNILWVTSEDNGPQLGCYGDTYASTPNLDALAQQSLRFKRCWSNAPVCAPARTTIISGRYATSLGGHHMRSGVTLPDDVVLYPRLLREAGYYCTNNSKTDYNFAGSAADAGWHDSSRKAHWRNRKEKDQPFFAIFNFTISHESKIRTRPHDAVHDPARAPLPAYHPDTPEVRQDWAQYYDKVSEMDRQVGDVLKQLKDDGLAESTIVFYYGDHGSGMPRSKRWPFDSGLRVPLIVHVPEAYRHLAPANYQPGALTEQLVAFVDLAPTALSLAGVEPPKNMHGVAFAGKFAAGPKRYLFGYRGRMDERIDRVRTCTDGRYLYMRHFYPERPYLKHVDYMFQTPTTQVWKQMFDAGLLNEAQAKFWQPKPVEELFDLQADPDEVNNLASDPKMKSKLAELRETTEAWMIRTSDMGLLPEAMMHERCQDISPWQYAQEHDDELSELALLSFELLDSDGQFSTAKRMTAVLRNDNAAWRYWGCRSLVSQGSAIMGRGDAGDRVFLSKTLNQLTGDESANVAIAACDALLATPGLQDDSGDEPLIDRLIELANVEDYGHFAAVASLNVIDFRRDHATKQQLARLKDLPLMVKSPPPRVGKYVTRLIEHITSTTTN